MSLWEENKDGGLGIAVILARRGTSAGASRIEPPAKTPGNANHLLLVKANDGVPVRYFAGAGWNRSGQFADRAAWEGYVKDLRGARREAAEHHRERETMKRAHGARAVRRCSGGGAAFAQNKYFADWPAGHRSARRRQTRRRAFHPDAAHGDAEPRTAGAALLARGHLDRRAAVRAASPRTRTCASAWSIASIPSWRRMRRACRAPITSMAPCSARCRSSCTCRSRAFVIA